MRHTVGRHHADLAALGPPSRMAAILKLNGGALRLCCRGCSVPPRRLARQLRGVVPSGCVLRSGSRFWAPPLSGVRLEPCRGSQRFNCLRG